MHWAAARNIAEVLAAATMGDVGLVNAADDKTGMVSGPQNNMVQASMAGSDVVQASAIEGDVVQASAIEGDVVQVSAIESDAVQVSATDNGDVGTVSGVYSDDSELNTDGLNMANVTYTMETDDAVVASVICKQNDYATLSVTLTDGDELMTGDEGFDGGTVRLSGSRGGNPTT